MGIQTYTEISAEEVARAMGDDPEFAMDVLATIADHASEYNVSEWESISRWHDVVPNFLEALAKCIRENNAK
jgi:hypothetical protein